MEDLLFIVKTMQEKNVKLVSNKEGIDTSEPMGKLFFTVISAINELERAITHERQLEGIALAKQKGPYKRRKRIAYPENWDEVYQKWSNRTISSKKAMALTGLKKTTFYKFISNEEKGGYVNGK